MGETTHGQRLSETEAMGRALALARRGEGWVEPNPMVGCVLLREGVLIGEGWHRRFGDRHAEREALRDAAERGESAAGATAVVTLEPCGHHGKQPPCTEALIEAGVSRVVAAMADPGEASGGGAAVLRAAGVEVALGLMEGEARRLNRPWLKRVATGRPWVIAKWAQTLDGRIATATGDSKWISGEASRRKVHELRARVDAILTGSGTVIADDPRLTARGVAVRRVARRVVMDRRGRCPAGAAALRPTQEGGQAVPAGEVVSEEPGVVLDRLGAEGCTNVLVEAGAGLVGAMLAGGWVDEVWAFIAGRVIGDPGALPIAAMPGREAGTIADALPLRLESVDRVGDDAWCRYLTRPDGSG
ncbi:MAG: bifunctional diaminohydroxyphosphoribosylaminopyrimidine deaminase/5-amino-6-(5-phosphoribosylamino)uracil reductase RibD [Planctomycetota bacterium]